MADLKISQLSSATALAGTEIVPVVQSGITKKATIAQILSPAAGQGINFSANGGDTLNQYDEGTWTPVIIGTTTSGVGTYTTQFAKYTRIGNSVFFQLSLGWSSHTGTGSLRITGLPFACGNLQSVISAIAYNLALSPTNTLGGYVNASATTIELLQLPIGGGGWANIPMDTDVLLLSISGTYLV